MQIDENIRELDRSRMSRGTARRHLRTRAKREIGVNIVFAFELHTAQPGENVFQQNDACPFAPCILNVIVRITLAVDKRRAEPHDSAKLLHACLREITGKDVSVAVDGGAGNWIPHANEIMRRSHIAAKARILRVDGGPGFFTEHKGAAAELLHFGRRHQPSNGVTVGISQPETGIDMDIGRGFLDLPVFLFVPRVIRKAAWVRRCWSRPVEHGANVYETRAN